MEFNLSLSETHKGEFFPENKLENIQPRLLRKSLRNCQNPKRFGPNVLRDLNFGDQTYLSQIFLGEKFLGTKKLDG